MDLNPNWSFVLDMRGVQAATGSGIAIPSGYYKGIVKETGGIVASTGRAQVAIRVELTEPAQYVGVVRTAFYNQPEKAEGDKSAPFWRAAFLSCGFTAAQIDAGPATVSGSLLNGKPCYVHYIAAEGDKRDSLLLLSPEDWAKGISGDSTGAAGAAGVGPAPIGLGAAPIGLGAGATAAAPAAAGGVDALRRALGAAQGGGLA
jgi:hypothetical protein